MIINDHYLLSHLLPGWSLEGETTRKEQSYRDNYFEKLPAFLSQTSS